MGHYTLNQDNNRFIGDIKIHNDDFDETYYGFENHQGRTFYLTMKSLLDVSFMEMVIIRRTKLRASTIKTFTAATFMDQSFRVMSAWPIA